MFSVVGLVVGAVAGFWGASVLSNPPKYPNPEQPEDPFKSIDVYKNNDDIADLPDIGRNDDDVGYAGMPRHPKPKTPLSPSSIGLEITSDTKR